MTNFLPKEILLSEPEALECVKMAFWGRKGEASNSGRWKLLAVYEISTGNLRAVLLLPNRPDEWRVVLAYSGAISKVRNMVSNITGWLSERELMVSTVQPYLIASKLALYFKLKYGKRLVLAGYSEGSQLAQFASACTNVPGVGINSAQLPEAIRRYLQQYTTLHGSGRFLLYNRGIAYTQEDANKQMDAFINISQLVYLCELLNTASCVSEI
ncbi:MAG: hypothetical protein N3J91_04200 [Verrucomicrobiae bacterium]|nr:hypothetical protein [Verrucomicrobiae bacterium]